MKKNRQKTNSYPLVLLNRNKEVADIYQSATSNSIHQERLRQPR
jgi:hypothetical protein